MESPFAIVVPSYPMITDFNQIEPTRFVTLLPNPSKISEICFIVSTTQVVPECGIALYYSFNTDEGWTVLGTVSAMAPTAIFRTGWGTMGVESCSCVYIGISLESGEFVNNLQSVIKDPAQYELPVMRIARDLYNYISSYGDEKSKCIIMPISTMDRWMEKTKARLERDPYYFYKYSLYCNK